MKLPNKQKSFVFTVLIFVFGLIFVFQVKAFSLPSKAQISETIQSIRSLKAPEFISEPSSESFDENSEIISEEKIKALRQKSTFRIPTIGELIQGAVKAGKNIIGTVKELFIGENNKTSEIKIAEVKQVEEIKIPAPKTAQQKITEQTFGKAKINFSLPKISLPNESLRIPQILEIPEIKVSQFITEKEKALHEPIKPARVIRISVVGDVAGDIWNGVVSEIKSVANNAVDLLSPNQQLVVVEEKSEAIQKKEISTLTAKRAEIKFSLPEISLPNESLRIPQILEIPEIKVSQFITEKEKALHEPIKPARVIRISVVGDVAEDAWNGIVSLFKNVSNNITNLFKPSENVVIVEEPKQINVPNDFSVVPSTIVRETVVKETSTPTIIKETKIVETTDLQRLRQFEFQLASLQLLIGSVDQQSKQSIQNIQQLAATQSQINSLAPRGSIPLTIYSPTISGGVTGLTDSDIPNDITIASTKVFSAGVSGATSTIAGNFSVTGDFNAGNILNISNNTLTITGGTVTTGSIIATSTATSTFAGPLASSADSGRFIIHGATTTGELWLNPYGGRISIASSTPMAASMLGSIGLTISTSTYFGSNVGIGTTTPTEQLALSGRLYVGGTGTSTIENNLQVRGTLKIGSNSVYLSDTQLTTTNSFTIATQNEANHLTLQTLGRVGVATATPWGVFSVEHNGTTNTMPVLVVSDEGTSSPSMLIDWAGKTGFGTATPWGRLSVEHFNSSDSNFPAFVVSDQGTSTPSFIVMNNNGYVGISTSTPAQAFSVGGSAYITGGLGVGIATTSNGGFQTSGMAVIGSILNVSGTATSTFTGGIQASSLNINSATASSTFTNGIQLSAGCFRMPDGSCAGASAGASTYLALSDTPSTFTTNSIPYTNIAATALLHNANFVFNGTNLGIGTSSPNAVLAVEHISTSTPNFPAFVISDEGTSTPSFIVMNATGYVGIGTTSPWAQFSIDMSPLVDADTPAFVVGDQGTSTSALLIDYLGRTGLGIVGTAPSHTLQINSTSLTPAIALSSTSSPQGYWAQIGGDGLKSSWADATYDAVYTMEVNNGKLYAGLGITAGEAEVWEYGTSTWTQIGGDSINSSWGSGYELVLKLKSYNGKLYAGLGNTTGDSEIWEYSGNTWLQIGGDGLNSSWTNNAERVQSIEVYGGNLYAGLGYVGAGFGQVWRYNGATWTQIAGGGENGSWSDKEELLWLLNHNGKLYAATGQTLGDAEVWEYNGSAWTKVGGDGINSSWPDATYQEVDNLISYNGKLYAGLGWSTAGLAEVWEYNGSSWTKVGGDAVNGSWNATDYENVMSFAVYNGLLYTGLGHSATDSEVWVYNGSRWTQIGGDSINLSWSGTTHEEVYSMQVFNGKLYAGLGYATAGDAEVWEYNTDSVVIAKSGIGLTIGNTLTIGSNNRVGIGIQNPEVDLDVLSSFRVGGSTLVASSSLVGISTSSPWGILSVEQTQSSNALLPAFVVSHKGTSTPSFVVMNNTGNIGIGDNNPTYPLSVRNISQIPIISISSATSSPYWVQRGGDGISSSWNTNYEYVQSLVVYNGKLYAGLGITAGDAEVWEYNNATWAQIGGDGISSSWNTNYEFVAKMIVYNGRLYATLGSGAGDAEVWEYNNTTWTQIGGDSINSSWGAGYDYAYSVAIFRGKLIVGLSVTAGEAEVWEYNGSTWTQIGGDSVNSSWTAAGLYEEVFSLATHNDKLYAGLGDTAADGEVWEYNGSAWTQIGGDSVNSSWSSTTYVNYMISYNGQLYAGTGSTAGMADVWVYNGSSWTQIGGDGLNSSWSTSYTQVQYMIAYNGKLYAGIGALAGQGEVWEYNGSTWTQIGGDTINSSWDATNYERIQSMAVFNGKLYAGVSGSTAGEAELWEYNTDSVAIAKSGVGLIIGNTLTIGSKNRVGIGIQNPEYDLDVVGTFRVGGSNLVASSSLVGIATTSPWGTLAIEQTQSSNEQLPAFVISDQGTSTPSLIVLNGTGRVGISTSTPAQAFSVGGSAYITGGLGVGIATTSNGGFQTSGMAVIGSILNVSGTATSTFTGGIKATSLDINSATASSTFANGIQLSAGCFRMPDGSCAGASAGASTYLALSDTPSTFTTNSIPYTNIAATALLHSANFVFNGTNLGIGTSSPNAVLAVEHISTSTPNFPAFVISDQGTSTPSFIVMNNNGYVGVGTSSPWGKFSVEIMATSDQYLPSFVVSDEGTSTPALAVYSSGITRIDQLQTGAMSFDTNAGAVSWIDMSVTSASATTTVASYSAMIDANSLLTIYAESDGSGGISRPSVGVGTTSPWGAFAVEHMVSPTSTIPVFVVSDQGTSTPSLIVLNATGRVGIGTSSPQGLLGIDNTTLGSTKPALLIKAGGSGDGLIAISVDADDTCVDGSIAAACALNDLAELFPTSEPLEAADIAMLDSVNNGKIKKANEEGRNKLAGVISTSPAIVFEGSGLKAMGGIYTASENKAPLSLSGRVPVKINDEGGNIQVGDPITISSIAGIGKKATTAGLIVGYSMEDWTPSSEKTQIIIIAETGYWMPLTLETNNESLTADSSGLLAQVVGIVIDWLKNAIVTIKEIVTDKITTKKLCLDNTCITEEQLKALLLNANLGSSTDLAIPPDNQTTGGDPTETIDTTPPVVTINGGNPIQLEIGSIYSDMGVTVTDNVNDNLGYKVSLDNGPEIYPNELQLDTSTPGEHTIIYSAVDQAGNIGTATKQVTVYDPNAITDTSSFVEPPVQDIPVEPPAQ